MTDAKPLLDVHKLKAVFRLDEGPLTAVDDVSFSVVAGKTIGIVGESGCGKSVTARAILRILDARGEIASGEIVYRPPGREPIDITRLDADGEAMRAVRGEEIALVFQEPMSSFSPVHTIGSQLLEAIRLHRDVSSQEARRLGIEALRKVGIPNPEQRIDAYSFELSGGLRQRAMIAIAISCNPHLLIADEPTTALDVTTQAQILDLLREMQRQNGMAIMLITHDLGVIAEMADSVVVMYLGQVAESAPVDTIFHAPAHPYTKALLRSIPSITGPSGGRLETITGSVPHPSKRPSGCPFHPRCPSFMPGVCDVREPQPVVLGDRHTVRCHLFSEKQV
jgi:oligopeptide/dipeptide ABC transporter ATP-binding protein